MKSISVLVLSGSLMIALAGPAAATGDWKKRVCERLKDQLEMTLAEYEHSASFGQGSYHRHHYLKHRHRIILRKIRYYCKVYHDDPHASPSENNTGGKWSRRWASLHH